MKVTSEKFSWNRLDFLKSAVIFGLTTGVTLIATSIDAGQFPSQVELLTALKVAVLSTASYLIKQFLTPGYRLLPIEPQNTNQNEPI